MGVVVHHLEQSRSQRVLWLLEELGVDYEVKLYKRNETTMLAPPELREVHPLGKSPVITDGSATVAESGAIIDYLVRKYGQGKGLRPDESSSDRTAYDFWLHFAEGSAMTPVLVAIYFGKFAGKEEQAEVKKSMSHPAFKQNTDFIESELAKTEYLAGNEFSAADVQMSFPIDVLDVCGFVGKEHPKLAAYISKTQARPAYKKALERGGPENYQLSAFKPMLV